MICAMNCYSVCYRMYDKVKIYMILSNMALITLISYMLCRVIRALLLSSAPITVILFSLRSLVNVSICVSVLIDTESL